MGLKPSDLTTEEKAKKISTAKSVISKTVLGKGMVVTKSVPDHHHTGHHSSIPVARLGINELNNSCVATDSPPTTAAVSNNIVQYSLNTFSQIFCGFVWMGLCNFAWKYITFDVCFLGNRGGSRISRKNDEGSETVNIQCEFCKTNRYHFQVQVLCAIPSISWVC